MIRTYRQEEDHGKRKGDERQGGFADPVRRSQEQRRQDRQGKFRCPRPEGGCKERILKFRKRVATPCVAVSVSGSGWPPFASKLGGYGKAIEEKA